MTTTNRITYGGDSLAGDVVILDFGEGRTGMVVAGPVEPQSVGRVLVEVSYRYEYGPAAPTPRPMSLKPETLLNVSRALRARKEAA